MTEMPLIVRVYHRPRSVKLTRIADLVGAADVQAVHIAEVIQYRPPGHPATTVLNPKAKDFIIL